MKSYSPDAPGTGSRGGEAGSAGGDGGGFGAGSGMGVGRLCRYATSLRQVAAKVDTGTFRAGPGRGLKWRGGQDILRLLEASEGAWTSNISTRRWRGGSKAGRARSSA